jgi:DNA-binding ferritin-like protein
MDLLATYFRFLQLYTHACHNFVYGPAFLSYHDFFGELYPIYETAYDQIIERMIGKKELCDVDEITKVAADMFIKENVAMQTPMQMFECVLHHEEMLCKLIYDIYPAASIGTQQLIGEMANQAEIRKYKLNQLLKV